MAMKARYTVAAGRVIAQKRAGTRSYYAADPLGSTIALYDAAQVKTDTWTYWPYGEVKSRTGTTATPFQFVGTLGYYRDGSTRTYVRARYLDSAKGRWQTEDPIGFGGGYNLFRYVGNEPTTHSDPSGLAGGRGPDLCPPRIPTDVPGKDVPSCRSRSLAGCTQSFFDTQRRCVDVSTGCCFYTVRWFKLSGTGTQCKGKCVLFESYGVDSSCRCSGGRVCVNVTQFPKGKTESSFDASS
jgi:RHS repeat-associated protein